MLGDDIPGWGYAGVAITVFGVYLVNKERGKQKTAETLDIDEVGSRSRGVIGSVRHIYLRRNKGKIWIWEAN